jgi:hypothetical protein
LRDKEAVFLFELLADACLCWNLRLLPPKTMVSGVGSSSGVRLFQNDSFAVDKVYYV